MAIALGENQINKAYLGSTDIQKMYLGSDLVFDNSSPPLSLKPIMTNFRVNDATPTHIHFDAPLGPVTGLTTQGFTVSGNTVSAIDTLLGYITVGTPFTYWDNNTVKKTGGNNSVVYDFDLQYIKNNIAEPTPLRIRYASLNGSGSKTGVDEANAYDYSQAGSNAIAGDKTYFLNGSYGNVNIVMANNGTEANPIIFQGYNQADGVGNAPSGIVKSTGMSFDSSKMPLLEGSGVAINTSSYYNVVRYFQADGYTDGAMPNGRDVYGVIYDNLYFKNGTYGTYLNHTAGHRFRMTNCYVGDMTSIGINGTNEYNLIADNYVCSSKVVSMDYYISIYGGVTGVSNIVMNNYIERFPTDSHSGHGVSLRAGDGYTLYITESLAENNTIINMGQSIEARHQGTTYNVFRGGSIEGGRDAGIYGVGLSFHDGGHYNIFDNIKINNTETAIRWYETSEDDVPGKRNGHHNTFKNLLVTDSAALVSGVSGTGGTWFEDIQDNNWFNCTFVDATWLWTAGVGGIDDSNLFQNCLFDDIRNYSSTGHTMSFNYNNWSNGSFAPQGTNTSTFDPQFVDRIDFEPTNDSLIKGNLIDGVFYDRNASQRATITTYGSYKDASEIETPDVDAPVLLTATINDDKPNDVELVFSESVTGTNIGFSLSGTTDSGFSSLTGSDTNWTGILTNSAQYNEVITLSYNSTIGNFEDLAGNKLADITNMSVVNYVGSVTGVEVFPQDNAASIDTEMHSIGSWIEKYNEVSCISQDVDVWDGAFALYSKAVVVGGRLEILIPVTSGKTYNVSLRAKRGFVGTKQIFQAWVGFSDFTSKTIDNTNYTEYTWKLTANITGSAIIRAYPSGNTGSVDDDMYLDKMSILEETAL